MSQSCINGPLTFLLSLEKKWFLSFTVCSTTIAIVAVCARDKDQKQIELIIKSIIATDRFVMVVIGFY